MDQRAHAVLASLPGAGSLGGPAWRPVRGAAELAPPWLRLPVVLEAAWQRRDDDRSSRALGNVLWGQFALFLFVRVHDDVLDGQHADRRLVIVGDRLFLASLAAFDAVPRLGRSFDRFCLACTRETLDGILEVQRLEAEPGRFRVRHLSAHRRVCAIFRTATVALCRRLGREAEVPWLLALLDVIAETSQIGDDLEDLAADLAVGRFTWVANVLLDLLPIRSAGPLETGARLTEGLLRPERADVIVRRLRWLSRRARAVVPDSAPEPVHALVADLMRLPGALEARLHEARVRHLFGRLEPTVA